MYMYMYMYITNYNLLYLMNICIDRPSQTQIVHKFLALVWYVCLLWLAISTRVPCKECNQ